VPKLESLSEKKGSGVKGMNGSGDTQRKRSLSYRGVPCLTLKNGLRFYTVEVKKRKVKRPKGLRE